MQKFKVTYVATIVVTDTIEANCLGEAEARGQMKLDAGKVNVREGKIDGVYIVAEKLKNECENM